MWTREFFSNSDYNAYIKNIEKCIRNSVEYKDWLQKIREEQKAYICAISNLTSDDCTIEIHHTPFTLYSLVDVIISNQKGKFCTFSISQEAMQLHFDNFIGFIPLTKTIHEEVHNDVIQVPIEKIRGNYKDFIKNYKIPLDVMSRIKSIIGVLE